MRRFTALLVAVVLLVCGLPVMAAEIPVSSPSPTPAAEKFSVKSGNYAFTTVEGEEITSKGFEDFVTVIVFFSPSDSSSFLTLDDMQCSDWISKKNIKVIAADISGRADKDIKDFRDFYGFTDIIFCHDNNEKYTKLISEGLAEKTVGKDSLKTPFTLIIDQGGVIRHGLVGYQKPDDLKNIIDGLIVEIPAPTGLKADISPSSEPRLFWKSSEKSQGYTIFRSESVDGEYSEIGSILNTTFSDDKAEIGKNYYYKICSYVTVGENRVDSEISEAVGIKAVPYTPNIKLKKTAAGVSLEITPVKDADGYRIYRSEAKLKEFSIVEDGELVEENRFTDTTASRGKTWYYKVCAYKLVDEEPVFGKTCEPVALLF